MKSVTYILVIIAYFAKLSINELFTALIDLEKLIETEDILVKLMNKYIDTEEMRLNEVKKMRDNFASFHQEARGEKFLYNPMNSFLLVKKLTRDWKQIQEIIDNDSGQALFKNLSTDLEFPDEEDLNGAAVALLRLQETYLLNTSMLSQGIVKEKLTHKKLTSEDCFELGRQSYIAGDNYHTALWMEEAQKLWLQEKNDGIAKLVSIFEHLAYSLYKLGELKRALSITMEILEMQPDHSVARANLIFYQNELGKSHKKGDDGTFEKEPNSNREYNHEKEEYRALCRGENRQSDKKKALLHCRYHSGNSPFLRLAPFREEEVYLQPRILIYRNFLSDEEINVITQLAQSRLRRATVQNYFTGELEIAQYRISKSAWLKNEEHPVIARVSQRIEDATGLDMRVAEELQVVNYGLGGHYEPHFDHARKEEVNAFVSLGTGNRIATWLNYMSDVEAGGATVFPTLGIGLYPEKGSSAFWFNLLRNGEGNPLTRHAACPVLLGTKWVSNKWIHERSQEFRRPCSTNSLE